jgi:hypothetical protein
VQCPQNRSRCVSRFPSMRCCRLRVGRSQVFSRNLGSASESPRVRLSVLQNEAAVIKVICHEDRPHATIAASLFDPDSRTSLPRRNAVLRLQKLTTEARLALNWWRPVLQRRRCLTH